MIHRRPRHLLEFVKEEIEREKCKKFPKYGGNEEINYIFEKSKESTPLNLTLCWVVKMFPSPQGLNNWCDRHYFLSVFTFF